MTEIETLRSQQGFDTTAGNAATGASGDAAALRPLPPDAMIIVPVRSFVLFPGVVMPVSIGRQKSVAAAQQAMRDQRQIGILMQHDGAIVEGSVLMPGVRVGRGAVVRHAILDKNVVVGPGEMVGVDLERDRERFAVSAGGVVAVGKGIWI